MIFNFNSIGSVSSQKPCLVPIKRAEVLNFTAESNLKSKGKHLSGPPMKKRTRSVSSLRIIKGRVRVNIGRGPNSAVTLPSSSLIKHIPLNRLKLAAKKVIRQQKLHPFRTKRRRVRRKNRKRKLRH